MQDGLNTEGKWMCNENEHGHLFKLQTKQCQEGYKIAMPEFAPGMYIRLNQTLLESTACREFDSSFINDDVPLQN